MSFIEVTVADGFGEFMVHLDESGEPVRMYTYAEDVGHHPKDRGYAEVESEWAEREVLHSSNYTRGRNELFVYAKSIAWVRRVWTAYLRRYVSPDDEEDIAKHTTTKCLT